jgi:uncharacterized protein (DUF1800 family)
VVLAPLIRGWPGLHGPLTYRSKDLGMASKEERVAHVLRRLSMGAQPELLASLGDADAAVTRALDLSGPAPQVPLGSPPPSYDTQRPIEIVPTIGWWIDQMRSSPRLIEERLVWFWHDHFATSLAKVRFPYLMAQQHATVRAHATGSFAELLHAMAKDPAMLVYLDGNGNAIGKVNENFGRECLELFTMGIGGGYSQRDVVEASRSFTGWVVNVPGRPYSARLERIGAAPWQAIAIPQRHDDGTKTLLGTTSALDLDGALDVILGQPATGRFVAGKLYRELTGLAADDETAKRLGDAFARDWSIMSLVEAIVADQSFLSEGAIRSRPRTPVEKLVGILQAGGATSFDLGIVRAKAGRGAGSSGVGEALRSIGFIPFVPPNVGGFPGGSGLLGPHQLVHTFDLLQTFETAPAVPDDVDALFARFGLFDVSRDTRHVVEAESDPGRRFALAAMSPEFAVA